MDDTWEEEPLPDETDDKGSIAPASFMADHPRRADTLYALGTGLFVAALHVLWHFPCAHLNDWADLAIVSGLRPPASFCPGIWRAIVFPLFRRLSFDDALITLRVCGMAAAALTATLFYILVREVLAVTVRQFSRTQAWRNVVAPLVSFVGAVVLSCGEPIWTGGQSFSPSGLFVLELVAAALLLARYARLGGFWRLAASMFLFGFLSGEYAAGLLLTVGAIVAFRQVLLEAQKAQLPFADIHDAGTPIALPAAFWLLGVFASVILGIRSFIATGGLEVWELSTGALPARYAVAYVLSVVTSANMFGWIGFAALTVVPFILSARHFLHAVNDDNPIAQAGLGTLGVAFVFALSQLSMIFQAWYWRWSEQVAVASPTLLCLAIVLSAGTLVLALAAFGFNFSCRAQAAETPKRKGSPFFILAVAVVLLLTVPGRYGAMRREAMSIIRDYVREVARECCGAKWVFTDGALDEGVELASLRYGRPVNALPMVAREGPREHYIRLRGAGGAEERMALKDSAASTLNAWKTDFPQNLTNSAFQIGFEVWRRTKEPLPPCSGLLARPAGFPPGELERGVKAANDLAERILDLCEADFFGSTPDPIVEEGLVRVQWRLARMMRTRAIAADLAGDSATALREADFADLLDNANPSLRSLNARIGKAGIRALRTMSPREHLRQALQRADFTAAKPYAEAVLSTDPGNADANFAIGMFYFVDELYSKAEIYLERCTRRRPDEPTFFNNLAIAQLMTRKLDLAEKNARRALELLPDSPEVKDTVRQVEKAKKAAQ
jgi:tetratricopeptide (TPR) repeat protein